MMQSFLTSHFFVIKPSARFRAVVGFLHFLAILASMLNSLPLVYQLPLIAGIAVLWRIHCKYWKTSAMRLRYTKTNGWEISFDGVDYVSGRILADTVVTGWGIFLRFKPDKRSTMSLLIANDALSADDFRRLRVGLILLGCGRI